MNKKKTLELRKAEKAIYAYYETHNMLEFYDKDVIIIFLKEALHFCVSEEENPRAQLLVGGKQIPEIPNATMFVIMEAWQDHFSPYPEISICLLMTFEPIKIENIVIDIDDTSITINRLQFTLKNNKKAIATSMTIDVPIFGSITISKN